MCEHASVPSSKIIYPHGHDSFLSMDHNIIVVHIQKPPNIFMKVCVLVSKKDICSFSNQICNFGSVE